MKKKTLLLSLLSLVTIFPLASCNKVHHNINEYILTYDIKEKEDFRILQLSDVHISLKDERERQKDLLQRIIQNSDCDMFVITGDCFTFADKYTAKEMINFYESQKKPWTLTWGNHDEQCYFSIDWLTGYLNDLSNQEGSYLLFKDIQNDDVFGNANFAINLTKNNKLFEQVIIMDSNRYDYTVPKYDHIKEDQVNWYKELINYTKNTINGGQNYDSLLYFHIPLPEWEDALKQVTEKEYWDDLKEGNLEPVYLYTDKATDTLVKQFKGENPSNPQYDAHLFDAIVELNSTKAISVGHDHVCNYVMKYKGVYLCYGVNSSDRIYYDDVNNLLGGRILTVKKDHSLRFEDHYEKYEF